MWPRVQTPPQPAETSAARMRKTTTVRVSFLRAGFPPAGQPEVSRGSEASWQNANVNAETSWKVSLRTKR